MPVAFVSSSNTGTSDAQGTSLAIPVPASTAVNHVVLCAIEMWWDSGTSPLVTAPTGFTICVDMILTGSGPQKLKVWWKRLTAADSGSYTFSWTGTQWRMGHAMMFSGAKLSGDLFPSGANINTATTAGATTTPTTTLSPAFAPGLVNFVANENAALQSTVPTSFTESQDGDYLHSNYRIPGSSGTYSASGGALATSTLQLSALLALEPEGGAVTTSLPAQRGLVKLGALLQT
jgi:hypothetical protein